MKCTGILTLSCVFLNCAQVSSDGPQSVPLNLAVSWRCEPTSTDLRIDYKYNGGAMATPMALNNVQFLVPVDGGVTKLQAILPPAAWYSFYVTSVASSYLLLFSYYLLNKCVFLCLGLYRNAEQKRILWKIPDISQKSENGGMSLEYAFILLMFSNEWYVLYKNNDKHLKGLKKTESKHRPLVFINGSTVASANASLRRQRCICWRSFLQVVACFYRARLSVFSR